MKFSIKILKKMEDLLDCAPVHFENIRNGSKMYEGRPNKPKYSVLRIGSVVMIKNSSNLLEHVYVIVTSLDVYKTFKEMIESKGLDRVLPDQYEMRVDIDSAVDRVYRTWYSEEIEEEFGVLCIGVMPL